jgi:hypothetical protein
VLLHHLVDGFELVVLGEDLEVAGVLEIDLCRQERG